MDGRRAIVRLVSPSHLGWTVEVNGTTYDDVLIPYPTPKRGQEFTALVTDTNTGTRFDQWQSNVSSAVLFSGPTVTSVPASSSIIR